MKRSFLIGVAWSGASSWIEQALNLLIFIAIARIIGTEQFGLAGMAMAFLLVFETLVRETLTEEIVQRPSLNDGFLEATFAVLMGVGTLIFLLLCALAPVAAAMYREPIVALLILAVSPVILMISGYGVSNALLRRRLAFDILGFQAVIGSIAGGIAGIWLALEGYGAWALIGQRLVMTFVNFVISNLAARWVPKRLPRRADFKMVSGLGPSVLVIKTFEMMTAQTPAVLLGVFSGPTSVAIYSLAVRFVEVLISIIVAPLRTVTQSVIAEMHRRSGESRDFILEVSQIAALLTCASLVGMAMISDPAVPIFFGEDWYETIQVVPLICISGCVFSVTLLQQAYLVAISRTRRWVRTVIAECLAGIVLVTIAGSFGPIWTAAAVSVRALVFLPIRTRIMLDPEKIPAARYTHWVIVLPAALAASMALVLGVWRYFALHQIPDVVYILITVILGVLTYAVLVWTLTPSVVQRALAFVRTARAERDA